MKCKTIEDMNRKYAWILNNQPEDIDQVAICILWNLSMIIQLIDDKEDFLVDEICMLPTFATVLNEYHFNSYKPKKDKLTFDINAIVRKRTFEEMEDLKEEYYQNAKNFGYKPILVQKVVFNSIFRILKILVRLISKLPRGPRYLLSRRLRFLRERWRAEGRFD